MPLPAGCLLLAYRVPSRPTSGRVLVWRRLKALAALKILDSIWSLPDTPDHEHHLTWLAQEIRELGGQATVFRATAVPGAGAPRRAAGRKTPNGKAPRRNP